jgi:hypothetical protein
LKCSASRAISSGRSVAIAKECIFSSDAPLKSRQKLVMLNQYAIGRLQFYLSQVETPQCKLQGTYIFV